MKLHVTAFLAALGVSAAWAGSAQAADRRPVVVELFTSQGCSSCPPANANLIELSHRSDVLALSFAVTYWDQLGWKDTFGKPEFTERQYAYETTLGERGPFTPQIVVNGHNSMVGGSLDEIEALIAARRIGAGPSIHLGKDRATIGPGAAPAAGADVWLVRYEPGVINVAVRRGENSGRSLPHGHVVRTLSRIGSWNGESEEYPLTSSAGELRTAILVQVHDAGPILAAATD